MKRLFTICGSLLLCAYANAYDFVVDGIYYNILSEEDKTCEVTNTTGSYDAKNYSGDIIIPTTANGYSVVSIGKYAFSYCSELTSVIIPEGILSIEYDAFEVCKNLTSINIPSSVKSIDRGAFSPSNLSNISVDANNTIYDSRNDCNAIIETSTNTLIIGFKSTIIPNSVTAIGDLAFSFCTGLKSITIPESVTIIGKKAFVNCSGLTSLYLPSSIDSIGFSAFCNCTGLKELTIADGVKSINGFLGCTSLTDITIPGSVIYICNNAFYACTGLKNVTMTNGIKSIGKDAFSECTNLTNINLPNSITSIESNAFINCSSLASIILPENLSTIGDCAFECCAKLGSMSIPKNVSTIGSCAFSHCSELNSIEIQNGVISIGDKAFSDCSNLQSIIIPNSVKSIGNDIFEDCSSLSSIINFAKNPQTFADEYFYVMSKDYTLHVLPGCKDSYQSSTIWGKCTITEDAEVPNDEKITILDGEEYSDPSKVSYYQLTYSRTFNNTNWQALYVPFSVPYNDFKDKFEIAWLNDVHQYDDNGDDEPDRTSLEFYLNKDGNLNPNTPYLIRAKETGTINITIFFADLSPAECNPFECSNFTRTFSICGTYSGVNGSTMYNNHYYAPSNGKLCYASNSNVSLKPQRWYLKISNKDGTEVTNLAPSIRMSIDGDMVEESNETSIISTIDKSKSAIYYTLDGLQIHKPTNRGIYTKNNKTIFVK